MAARTTCTSVLLAAFIAATAVFAEKATLAPTSQLVSQGDTFELTCELTTAVKAGKNQNIQFKKRQNAEQKPLLISINLVTMDSTYTERSTVNAIPDADGHAIGYSLSIEDAITEDSGEYGCVLATNLESNPADMVWANVTVKVYHDPRYLYKDISDSASRSDNSAMTMYFTMFDLPAEQIKTLDMYAVAKNGTKVLLEDGKSYQLTKKEAVHLMCVATGSSPEPAVSMWLGDEDITRQLFNRSTVRVLTTATPHMGTVTFNTSVTSREIFEIHMPQTISCKAGVRGVDDGRSVFIHTLFRHAPIVKCEDVMAKPGNEAVLNCTIRANPKVTNVTWVVSFPNKANEIIEGAPYNIIIKHLPNNITHTQLIIKHAFENHFLNRYHVNATNTEGSTEMAALLTKDPHAGKSKGAASSLAASISLVICTALWRMS